MPSTAPASERAPSAPPGPTAAAPARAAPVAARDVRQRRAWSGWAWWAAVAGVLAAVGAARLLALTWQPVGLHVDEAQYWLWTQALDWGYWSKPPGIAALIAASTALFGDGTTGIRALALLCWLLSAAVLAGLGRAMHSPAAGAWAGGLWLCTPASNLLGLVATTDALLVLGWAVVMALAWRVMPALPRAALSRTTSDPPLSPTVHRHTPPSLTGERTQQLAGWAALGLAWGLALLSKYTAAALAPTLAWLGWRWAGRRLGTRVTLALAFSVSLAVAAAVLAPHLVWNHIHGWPTLQHTLEITVGAPSRPEAASLGEALAAAAQRALQFGAGVLLLAGPGVWLAGVWAWRAQRTGGSAVACDARRWAAAFALPLLAIGLAQALWSKPQLNWTTPALLGVCLWLGLRLAEGRRTPAANPALPESASQPAPPPPLPPAGDAVCKPRPGTGSVRVGMAASMALALLLAASPQVREPAAPVQPPDFWHKTRHWPGALQGLETVVRREPRPIWTADRDVLVQAAYAWRAWSPPLRAYRTAPAPRHHFDWTRPAPPVAQAPEAVWWLDRSAPPPELRAQWAHAEPVHSAAHGPLALQLWRLSHPHRSTP